MNWRPSGRTDLFCWRWGPLVASLGQIWWDDFTGNPWKPPKFGSKNHGFLWIFSIHWMRLKQNRLNCVLACVGIAEMFAAVRQPNVRKHRFYYLNCAIMVPQVILPVKSFHMWWGVWRPTQCIKWHRALRELCAARLRWQHRTIDVVKCGRHSWLVSLSYGSKTFQN